MSGGIILPILFGILVLGLFGYSQDVFAEDLYVTSCSSDEIKRYQGYGSSSYIGNFVSAGSGGLDCPFDLKFDAAGNLYVVSVHTNQILKYDQNGNFVSVFVATGSGGLTAPRQIAFGPDGNLYVSNVPSSFDGNVLRYDGTTGAFIDEFVPSGIGLSIPIGLEFGPNGNLFVVNYFTNAVLEFDGTTGAYVGVFVSSNSGGIDIPNSLTFGPDGNLYVTAQLQSKVYRYDGTTGAFIDVFVDNSNSILNGARDLTFGPDGNLYVVSDSGQKVVKYDGTTGAWIGTPVHSNQGSIPGEGGIDQPIGIEFGPDTASPQVRVHIPQENSPISDNLGAIVFSLSENSASGTITFTRTGGSTDSQSHVYDIPSNSLMESSNLVEISQMLLAPNFIPLVNDAIYTIEISIIDPAGNIGFAISPNHKFDNVAPDAPIIDPLGYVNTEFITVTGTSEPGSIVKLYDGVDSNSGNQLTPFAVADDFGNWSLTPYSNYFAGTWPEGTTLNLIATATDEAQNISADSSQETVVVDLTAPSAPLIDPVTSPTNDNTPTITGTAEAYSAVSLFNGAISIGTGQTDSLGNWSVTMTPQSDGVLSFFAITTDRAGNVSDHSLSETLTIDTVLPSILITFPQDGTGIKSPTFTITGTSHDAFTGIANVDVSISGEHGFLTATGTDSWSFDANGLSFGEHVITARAYDNAGNFAEHSITITVRDLVPRVIIPPNPIQFNGYGSDIQSGDFNGDGFDDLIVTAPNDPNGYLGSPIPSEIHVYFGSAVGLQSNPVILQVSVFGDHGYTVNPLASGDLNNDGYDDIVVGSSLYPNNSINLGKVQVFLGSDSFDGIIDYELDGPNDLSNFGHSVAIGDINGDNIDDLIVSSPGEAGLDSNGEVQIFFGSQNSFDLVRDSQISYSSFPRNNFLGTDLEVGDLNDDGIGDLIIADYNKDVDFDNSPEGEVRIFFGSSTRFDTLPGTYVTTPDFILTGELAPVNSQGVFGFSLSTGDVNDDSIDDLVVGEVGMLRYAIFYGGPTFDNQIDDTITAHVPKSLWFGIDSSFGDIDNDGKNDLLVSDDTHLVPPNLYGTGLVNSYDVSGISNETPMITIIGGVPDGFAGSSFGRSIITGDFDGDNGYEIAVSEPLFNIHGAVQIFTCNAGGDYLTVDADLDGIVNVCDNDDDNDGIFDEVDTVNLDNTNNAFDDGVTSGIIVRGDRNWNIFDTFDVPETTSNDGVRIKVGSGSQLAQVIGNGVCTVDDPTVDVNILDPNGADFIFSCGSTTVQVISGTVQLSTNYNGQEIVAELNDNQGMTVDSDGQSILYLTNIGDSQITTIINGVDKSIVSGETFVLSDNEKIEICHKNKKTLSISSYSIGDHLNHGDTIGACTNTP